MLAAKVERLLIPCRFPGCRLVDGHSANWIDRHFFAFSLKHAPVEGRLPLRVHIIVWLEQCKCYSRKHLLSMPQTHPKIRMVGDSPQIQTMHITNSLYGA